MAQARDALSQQLSFAAWGLVAAEYWRQLVPEPSAALVPYGGDPLKVSPATYPTKTFLEGRIFKRERDPREADNDVYVCPPVVCDVCVQTCPNVIADVGVQTQMAKHSAEVQYGGDPAQPAGGSEEELYESARKRARHLETRTQATMTVDNTGPTEREQFYLEQIESLQREKINLRKVRLCYCISSLVCYSRPLHAMRLSERFFYFLRVTTTKGATPCSSTATWKKRWRQ